MPFDVKGAIVRTMRVATSYTRDDGAEVKLTNSAGGVIVTVRPDSTSRGKFAQFCERRGLSAVAAERSGGADGTYNRRTGAVQRPEQPEPRDYRQDATVTAWQVSGDGAALSELVGMDEHGRRGEPKPFVASWAFALAVRVPVVAGGNGEERPRPSMGSAFGKPAQVKATAATLDGYRVQRHIAYTRAAAAERKAAGLPDDE